MPFGLTECYGPAAVSGSERPARKARHRRPAARRQRAARRRSRDAGGRPPGAPGEAWLRGNVMRGYWNKPDETARAFDRRRLAAQRGPDPIDADGYIPYVGRIKLMLKVGGENVSIEEVENVVASHEGVAECGAVGVPDPRKAGGGAGLCRLGVPGMQSEEAELRPWLEARLARFKQPRDILFVDETAAARQRQDRPGDAQPMGAGRHWREPGRGERDVNHYGPIDDFRVFELYPDIQLSRDNVEHYRALAQGRLVFNRCHDCGYWIYPHRPICPECLSWNVKPEEVSGYGQGVHVHAAAPAARRNQPYPGADAGGGGRTRRAEGTSLPVPHRQLRPRRDRPRHAGAAHLDRGGEPQLARLRAGSGRTGGR